MLTWSDIPAPGLAKSRAQREATVPERPLGYGSIIHAGPCDCGRNLEGALAPGELPVAPFLSQAGVCDLEGGVRLEKQLLLGRGGWGAM